MRAEIETYQATEEKHGKGTFFYTDCGNVMYSINGKTAYHGKLCPKCFWEGKQVTLYIRGSKEANEHWKQRFGRGEMELEST